MAQRCIIMTRDLAWALGIDAANRQMRKAGRKKWNLEDRNLAARVTNHAYPLEVQFPWLTKEQADAIRERDGLV